MSRLELLKIRVSNEAPFDHQAYTIWLHDMIITKVRHELESLATSEENKRAITSLLRLNSLQFAK